MATSFQLIHGLDSSDSYAPVMKLPSIRFLLAIFAHFDLEIHQMDVVRAFLIGELDDDIYLEVPEGERK